MTQTKAPPSMLRVHQVAALLGVHRDTVKVIPASSLPFTRINERGDRRYARVDVEAYLAARREQ